MGYGSGYLGGYGDTFPLWPTLIVEWELTAGVWTDIADYLSSVTTRRGRNAELGAFETGTMQLTLRNEDRRFDPAHEAGPYYGNLRPNRRIRFQVTYLGVTYPVFLGYVDRITQTYDGPNLITAQVDLSDRFKILNRIELDTSVYAAEVATDEPTHWYRLGDPNEGVALDRVGGATATLVAGPDALGGDGLVVKEDDTGLEVVDTATMYQVPYPLFAGDTFTIEILVRSGDPAQQGANILGQVTGGVFLSLGQLDGFGTLEWRMSAGGTPSGAFAGALAVPGAGNEGFTHHVVLRYTAGVMEFFLDGTLTDTATPAITIPAGGPGTFTIGSDFAWLGFYDEVAIYDYALPDARITVHHDAYWQPWAGDIPSQRLERILELAGVSPFDYALDAGAGTYQSTNLGGNVLSYLQQVEKTELGSLFVTRDGDLRFLGRREQQQGDYLTSAVTLVDEPPAPGEVPYRSVTFEVDDADLITRATVSREGSAAVTYYDAAAAAEFGWIDYGADGLLHDTDTYSAHLAEWIVNTHSSPSQRVGAVTLTPMAAPATMYPEVLGLEIGDRVTLTRRPKVGDPNTADYRLESVAHAVAGGWTTTLQLSPFNVGADSLPVFVWGETPWGEHVWGI